MSVHAFVSNTSWFALPREHNVAYDSVYILFVAALHTAYYSGRYKLHCACAQYNQQHIFPLEDVRLQSADDFGGW